MSSEEVGVLRKLGKQAVWLLRKIRTGKVIDGPADEPNVDAGEEDREEGDEEGEDGEGEEERVENGADFLDAVDVDDGYSPQIDPITTATVDHDTNSEAHPKAAMSEADLAKAKQRILDSLGTNQAKTDSSETNGDGTQSLARPHPVTEPEMEGGGGLEERADENLVLHATLDMLVTIIGEFYGQRDLLDGRLLWDEVQ